MLLQAFSHFASSVREVYTWLCLTGISGKSFGRSKEIYHMLKCFHYPFPLRLNIHVSKYYRRSHDNYLNIYQLLLSRQCLPLVTVRDITWMNAWPVYSMNCYKSLIWMTLIFVLCRKFARKLSAHEKIGVEWYVSEQVCRYYKYLAWLLKVTFYVNC